MEDLIQLAWKAGFAASILMLVVMCGQRAGPLLASIAMTYPFNVGVGFTLMVLNRSDEFMAAAGLSGFALAGGVFAFMTGYVLASPLGGFLKPWLVGIAAWIGVAAIALSFTMTWPLAIALAAGGALAAGVLVKKRQTPPILTRGGGAGGWTASVARAVFGGLIIAAVAVYSKELGPAISGMALAFPTMMSASLWILNRRFGDAFAAETIYRSRWALASYTSFVFSMALLAVPLGDVRAMVASACIAGSASFLVYRINRPRHA